MQRVFSVGFDNDGQDVGASNRMQPRLNSRYSTADAGVYWAADEAFRFADFLDQLLPVRQLSRSAPAGAPGMLGHRNDESMYFREIHKRQMLTELFTLGGMNAAVVAFKPFFADGFDVLADELGIHLRIITQPAWGFTEQLRNAALLFQPAVYFFPGAILSFIHFAFAVFRPAALPVDKALGTVNNRTNTAGNV